MLFSPLTRRIGLKINPDYEAFKFFFSPGSVKFGKLYADVLRKICLGPED
jgi:hypothetical protein